MNQQLKDAICYMEGVATQLERFPIGSGAPSADDWLQAQHIRTIIAAAKSLQAEVEALKKP